MQIKVNLFIVLLVSLLLTESLAQDYARVDGYAQSVPFPEKQNIPALAKALSHDCKTEKETVRAFFIWIAENIQYDIKGAQNKEGAGLQERVARQTPRRVLQSKKGVCAGYSNLLVALCEAAGIQAFKVDGFTKDHDGKVSPKGHAWCLVRTDGAWGLIDPTWGAGEVSGDKYYKRLTKRISSVGRAGCARLPPGAITSMRNCKPLNRSCRKV